MHGRVKVRTTEEQREIARQEKSKKAKSYLNSLKIILDKRASSSYNQEALDLTANLLIGNPDVITLWNYRREIFLNIKCDDDLETYQKLLEKDLSLTEQCLKVNPKSYGSWHHRIWVLDNMPQPNWEKELKLCTKYLELDERNFHCWDYRRIVTERSNVSDMSEYEFTLKKIETNFSNYSAWHLRSKLLPRIFPDPDKKFPIDEVKHKEELELVDNAVFTDPNDQSAWFYLRWLFNLTEAKTSLVFAESKSDEILVVTSRKLKLDVDIGLGVTIEVEINGNLIKGDWVSNETASCMWSFKPEFKIQPTDTIYIKLKENGTEYNKQKIEPFSSATFQPNFSPTFSQSLVETLKSQLSFFEELLDLEPDSKWTLLTNIFLMLAVDLKQHQQQITEVLEKLKRIDPLRSGYYSDIRNKILAESAISNQFGKKFEIRDKNLSRLYHPQFLCHYEDIDLSGNDLRSDSLINLGVLLKCKNLNLSRNKIDTITNFPVLQELEILLLEDNLIESINVDFLKKLPKLKRISLVGNPIADNKDAVEELAKGIKKIEISISGVKLPDLILRVHNVMKSSSRLVTIKKLDLSLVCRTVEVQSSKIPQEKNPSLSTFKFF